MKKLVLSLAILVAAVSSYAQGTVAFKTFGSGANGSVNAKITNPDGTTPIQGTTYTVEMLYGAVGADISTFLSAGTANPQTGNFAGYVSAANPNLVNVPIGSSVNVYFRAFDNGGGLISSYNNATIRGQSGVVTVASAGDPQNPTTIPVPVGLQPFSLAIVGVPEPSTIALGVVGAAALLLRRRRA